MAALMLRYTPSDHETKSLSEHALTPQETVTEVAPHRDGTVQVRQRLIFETPPEDGKPVGLWISGRGVGKDPRTDRRLVMMPKLSSLSAVELSTADDSIRTSPKTLGELDIVVEESAKKGFDHPEVHFMFTPKDSDGEAAQWSRGRHVVELEYVLDEVFMTVAGEEFFALPIPTIGNGQHTLKTHTVDIDTDGPVYCPALRAEYSDPQGSIDSTPAEESPTTRSPGLLCRQKTGEGWAVPGEELLHDYAVIDAVRIMIDADPESVPASDIDP
ncbi:MULTISPECIES: hypothetical protein [unclassified Brevibacterium]|uniref:hypothetical protein n=1 Tax=unclassified Brevibacterium TaxID=2614124 RepID=UPI001091C3C2|nr:hypothetical protein [Brevibacterium sp. S22]